MQTSDYAFYISILALLVSLGALAWNVWQKFIFVRPTIQVSFNLGSIMLPHDAGSYRPSGNKLLTLVATNMGPGPAILTGCIVKTRASGMNFRNELGMINPIHGDPMAASPASIGPFSGGLPAKIDAGDSKTFYFPYEEGGFLAKPVSVIGVVDSYRRMSWCRKSDVRLIVTKYRNDFPLNGTQKRRAPSANL